MIIVSCILVIIMKEGTNNLILLYFAWWYNRGFIKLLKYLKAVLIYLTDLFSVKLIFQTLFDPWKRDRTSYKGLPLNERFQVLMLNIATRLIGFLIKIIFFIVYLVFLIAFLIISAISIIFWLALPLLIIFLIILGYMEVKR